MINLFETINGVAGAAAPDNKPLPEGKGFGVRDREIALLIKKIDFFDKLSLCTHLRAEALFYSAVIIFV